MANKSSEPRITYVSYIAATPERIWGALTCPADTKQYFFGRAVESDWKAGSPVTFWMPDGRVDVRGVVLECDPPRRLAYTWHVEWIDEYRALPESRVTFELEPFGPVVRLTMVHEDHLEPISSEYYEGGRRGWPAVLSGLKTLAETGSGLPEFDWRAALNAPEEA